MGDIRNILSKSVKINLLGEEYNFLVTLFGLRYLAEVYGSAAKAEQVLTHNLSEFVELSKKNPEQSTRTLPEELYDVILHYVKAGIEHNQFDKQGNVVRELPSFHELKMNFAPEQIVSEVIPVLVQIREISFAQVIKKEGAQETGDPH